MWMDIPRVAEAFFLNADKLADFASKPGHEAKYHLIVDTHGTMVSTWHADKMIKDFRATQSPEVLIADREDAIERYRALFRASETLAEAV